MIIIRTQKIALLCVQRAIRNYMVGKLWPWWQVSSILEIRGYDMRKMVMIRRRKMVMMMMMTIRRRKMVMMMMTQMMVMMVPMMMVMSDFSFQLWLGVKPGLKCFHFAEIREQVILVIIIMIFFIIIFIVVAVIIIIVIVIIMISWRRSEALPRVKSPLRNLPKKLLRDFTHSWSMRR